MLLIYLFFEYITLDIKLSRFLVNKYFSYELFESKFEIGDFCFLDKLVISELIKSIFVILNSLVKILLKDAYL